MKKQTKTEKLQRQISRSIDKANRAYKKAGAAQRRVMIAEDALKQLSMGKFVATCGTYVGAYTLAREAKVNEPIQLNTLLHNPMLKSPCNVCARGALLLAAVRHRNDCTVQHDGHTSEVRFVKEFPRSQQELIEFAFERYGKGHDWCEKFLSLDEQESPDKRLTIILKNIIRNNGTFKTSQR